MDVLESGSGQFAPVKMVANQEQDLLMKAQDWLQIFIFFWILCDLGCDCSAMFYNMNFKKSVLNEIITVAKWATTHFSFYSTQLFNAGKSDSGMVPRCPHTWSKILSLLSSWGDPWWRLEWNKPQQSIVSARGEETALFFTCAFLQLMWPQYNLLNKGLLL